MKITTLIEKNERVHGHIKNQAHQKREILFTRKDDTNYE